MKTTPTAAVLATATSPASPSNIKRVKTFILQRSSLSGSSLGVRARGKPVLVTVGKGRFGKRPPAPNDPKNSSRSSNDNSNDSGIGYDSNSESQFWLSSDDSRSLGSKSATAATTILQASGFPVIMPSFQSVSHLNSGAAEKFVGKKLEDTLKAESYQHQQPKIETHSSFSEDSATSDMFFKKVDNISDHSLSFIPQIKNAPISSIPVKRPRFSFQNQNKGTSNGLKLKNQNQNQAGNGGRATIGKRFPLEAAPSLSSQLSATSQDGSVQLQILTEPEEQHRARYQTEGSRGAIKDRKGNGFPSVKLVGYNKSTTLQIFIGTDQGKVSPHMFYQVCKVTGKSSTPCIEKKVEGTIVIEIDFEPSKDMIVSCDCVGILKERNVDVEQRFPFHHAAASRKKSTKCRLIFRATIINNDGMEETLQATSLPIVCTQPPGQPEICKKSHVGYPAKGGFELYVIGKNFLKDTKIVIQEESPRGEILWEARSDLQKDYLQQNHFICLIPPYKDQSITKPVECRLTCSSGGRTSEPQRFVYIPNGSAAYYEYLEAVSHDPSVILPPYPPTSVGSPKLQHQLSNEEPMISRENFLSGNGRSETLADPLLTAAEGTTTTAAIVTMGTTPLTLTYENSMSPPTTAQEARQVVNELQTLLHQSVENLRTLDREVSLGSTSPPAVTSGLTTTSYMDSNLKRSLGIGATAFVQTTTTTDSQPSLPMSLGFLAPDQQQLSPPVHSLQQDIIPLTCGTTTTTEPTSLPQLMDSISGIGSHDLLAPSLICQPAGGSFQGQIMQNDPMVGGMSPIIGPMIESPTVATCLTDILMKVEPNSPEANTAVTTAPATTPSEPSFLTQHGCITQVTQMSDNELLSYINPSCFEQGLEQAMKN